MPNKQTILYCNCSFKNLIPEERKQKDREVLKTAEADVIAVSDLCQLAAQRDPRLSELAATSNLTIAACYPRAIRWLFQWAGSPLRDDVHIVNLRTESLRDSPAVRQHPCPSAPISGSPAHDESTPNSQLSTLHAQPSPPHTPHSLDDDVTPQGDWVPWFPIIDYERCTNCKQCLSFCPFDVYSRSEEDKVVVTQPENCKNDCPACARVCPAVAIIFPKLIDSPINGADVDPEDLEKAKGRLEEQKRELDAKGIHSVLAQRKLKALARRMAAQYAQDPIEDAT